MNLSIPAKKPRIKQKAQALDQRSITVCPIRAASDRRLTGMEMRALLILCSYTNKAGVAWVSLERIGKDLSVSRPRAGHLVKRLGELGYMRVIHKGFKGYCADSRQVIFKPGISADDAAAIAGELAPYQLDQQQREADRMKADQDKQQAKQQAKRIAANKRRGNNQAVAVSGLGDATSELVVLQLVTQQVFAGVDADILALAIEAAGPGATVEQINQAIDDLLR